MAKKSLIRRNEERKKSSLIQREKRLSLKSIISNKDLSLSERFSAQVKLSQLARNGSKSRIRNRCALTGRARGNLRKFGMSRIALRELASWGQVPGLIKSSW
jgi:small subunit ribosomal protein S14